MKYSVIFDGPPSHESGRFVEVEDVAGRSVSIGEWTQRSDGLWALEFDFPQEVFKEISKAHETREARWHSKPGTDFTCLEMAGAMCGEAGEFANTVKKIRRDELGLVGNKDGESINKLRRKAEDEAGDTFHYLVLTCRHLGVDLWAGIRRTFNQKSEELGFPERL